MKEKEPENPVVYLTKVVKKLDVKNRNGIVALIIINLSVILLFKFYLKGSGLLSWKKLSWKLIYSAFSNCLAILKDFLITRKIPNPPAINGKIINGLVE